MATVISVAFAAVAGVSALLAIGAAFVADGARNDWLAVVALAALAVALFAVALID